MKAQLEQYRAIAASLRAQFEQLKENTASLKAQTEQLEAIRASVKPLKTEIDLEDRLAEFVERMESQNPKTPDSSNPAQMTADLDLLEEVALKDIEESGLYDHGRMQKLLNGELEPLPHEKPALKNEAARELLRKLFPASGQ